MKNVLCLLGFHKWIRGLDEDGKKVAVCRRCDKQEHGPFHLHPI